MSDIDETVDGMLVNFLGLSSALRPHSLRNGAPCCAACGARDPLRSVAPGVFACPDCLQVGARDLEEASS